ncbi:hypothetical protein KY366_05825 [Candidatus Woesearchaeota archaeon]|nr:hypothetical protein [Candidatus Woesearchaeota archaeon]
MDILDLISNKEEKDKLLESLQKKKEKLLKKNEVNIALTEYKQAQDMAQYNDGGGWTVNGILLSGMLIMLGLIIKYLKDPAYKMIIFLLSALGLYLTFFIYWVFEMDCGKLKRIGYKRCQKIETVLGMNLHTKVKKEYPKGAQKILLYTVLIIFAIIWLYIFVPSITGILIDILK